MTPDSLESTQFALREFIFDGCDQAMAKAIFAFADSLTTRHSLTSRRPSFWALVRRSLDGPVLQALSRSAIPVVPELAAFVPSKLGSTTPPEQPTARGNHDSQPRLEKMRGSQEQIENLYLWQIFLRHAARLYIARRGDAYTTQDQEALATLDTLRKVAFAMGIPKPVTATTTLECSGQPVRRRAVNYPPALFHHCDLCWRSAMHSAAQQWFPKRLSTNDYSLRFCVYHVPLEDPPPFNRYRTDIRYRSAFQKEIVLRNQELRGHRALSLIPPVKGTPAEWQKAAYDIVHSAMQPKSCNAQSSTRCTLSNGATLISGV